MDETLSERQQALIAKTKKVFSKEKHPKKGIGDELELMKLKGKKWQDLTGEEMDVIYNFFFFSSEGFRYFLPAYIIYMVSNSKQLGSDMLVDGMLRQLAKTWDSWKHTNLCAIFTEKQREVIRDFLDMYDELFLQIPDHYVLQFNPQRRSAMRKFAEKRRSEQRQILHKARDYWAKCEETP